MKTLILLLPALAYSAPNNVSVLSTTPTQAVVAVTPACGSSVTIELSTSNTYTPLANDVNSAYFTGANDSSQRGDATLSSGQSMTLVLGLRGRAYKDVAGVWRSRALQAGTFYYLRLTDCSGSAATTFTTKLPAIGNSWPETYPVDPDTPGDYAWPNVTTPTGFASANEQMIDPQTGILVNRVTGSKQFTPNPNTGTALPRMGFVDDSATWVIGGSATFTSTGAGPNAKLYIPIDTSTIVGSSGNLLNQSQANNIIDYVQAVVGGSASATGADATADLCLTIDGLNCLAGSTTATKDFSSAGSPWTFGGTQAYMADWWSGKVPTVSTPDIYRCSTTANLSSGILTRTSGDYFSKNLAVGSSVWISGTRYRVTANNGPSSITIASPPADGSGIAVLQPNFGILIWKDTTTAATSITVTTTTFNFGWSYGTSSYLNGAYMDWASATKTGGGYRIWFIMGGSGLGMLGWLNPATAAVNTLGWAGYPFNTTGNGAAVNMTGGFGSAFSPSDPTTYYGVGSDGTHSIVTSVTAASNSQRAYPMGVGSTGSGYQASQSVTNLSPSPYYLLAEIAAFNPLFDTATYTTCSIDGMQGQYLIIRCTNGGQDKLPGGWDVIWDTTKGTAGLGNNPVVGTFFTASKGNATYTPARWCVLHANIQEGNIGLLNVTTNCLGGTGTCREGSFTAPFWTGTFDAQYGTTLAADMTAGQTTMTLSGTPSFDSINVGDHFQIGTSTGSELVKVTDVSLAPTYSISRSYNQGGVGKTHTAGDNVVGVCGVYAEASTAQIWWDFVGDPLGTNPAGTSILTDATALQSHQSYRSGTFVVPDGTATCTSVTAGSASCTAIRIGAVPGSLGQPITYYLNNYGGFAGVQPQVNGGLHPHILQTDHTFSTDTLLPNPYTAHAVTHVGVTTYLYKVAVTLNRKLVPTVAFSGSHVLLDVSGPSSVLNDTSADNWKYCVAAATNECVTGSAVGDVYANVPPLSVLGCNTSTDTDANSNFTRDLCVLEQNPWWFGGVTQSLITGTDSLGGNRRKLTGIGYRYHRQGPNFASPGSVSPGSEVFSFTCQWCDGQRGEYMTAVLPALASADSTARGTFCANCSVTLKGPAGTASAWVKFGYLEYGTAAQARCSSRQEACVANAASVNQTTPYAYVTTDAPAKLSCSSGCAVAVPVLPEHIAYWWPEYFDGSGNQIGGGATFTSTLIRP